jgi:long-subunit acyl-CoA synthetase (AMP-forming)
MILNSTRLLKTDIEYIITHSGAKLVLVDHEYASLVRDCPVPVIISQDTGRIGDPYETFLTEGRRFSRERGWGGLVMEPDESANATLNYTSGTTGRVWITAMQDQSTNVSVLAKGCHVHSSRSVQCLIPRLI